MLYTQNGGVGIGGTVGPRGGIVIRHECTALYLIIMIIRLAHWRTWHKSSTPKIVNKLMAAQLWPCHLGTSCTGTSNTCIHTFLQCYTVVWLVEINSSSCECWDTIISCKSFIITIETAVQGLISLQMYGNVDQTGFTGLYLLSHFYLQQCTHTIVVPCIFNTVLLILWDATQT